MKHKCCILIILFLPLTVTVTNKFIFSTGRGNGKAMKFGQAMLGEIYELKGRRCGSRKNQIFPILKFFVGRLK